MSVTAHFDERVEALIAGTAPLVRDAIVKAAYGLLKDVAGASVADLLEGLGAKGLDEVIEHLRNLAAKLATAPVDIEATGAEAPIAFIKG